MIDIIKEMESEASPAAPVVTSTESGKGLYSRFAQFALVDLPAESVVLGLKAYLLSLSLFE